ncbi:tannase-domain-containing protein [Lentithecium fluviatile CBS 122367]|uniref:Carboxylic ester hydrolase n=1 Tax=Lentithecium fluviatile CBS 122367 TaxID=1168545 RepID=A0A6G1IPG7_9PLEO|nr:tannase-domain-containing protein [Lentithecium fluviatile CBS 122367]
MRPEPRCSECLICCTTARMPDGTSEAFSGVATLPSDRAGYTQNFKIAPEEFAEYRSALAVLDSFHAVPSFNDLFFCQVKIYLNHDGSDDKTLVEVWLPPNEKLWNGRFQATGGGGFATGIFDTALAPALSQGYAASSTDGGHGTQYTDLSWSLNPDGTVNWDLLHNFATRSLAEQITVGKSIAEQYYGKKPHHSYWNGCSQGGRQGYVVAQKYPHLVDGILAAAPAISLTHLAMGEFWPQLVMKEAGIWMSSCELDFFLQKAIESCDMLDGVSDGIITDPDVCDFDPLHMIGKTFYCDGKEGEITQAMADVVRRIEEGPHTPFKRKIWHGLPLGTSTHFLAATTTSTEGMRAPVPIPISSNYMQSLLLRDPSFNVTKLTYGDYMSLWAQSSYEYGWLLDADEPNLRNFQESGGKLLTWHGINDGVIPYHNTVRYRERVEMVMGGAQKVDSFYRLFLAPGVGHCNGGPGPVPQDPLGALVDWVEKGEAPETLEASTVNAQGDLVSRDLCAWPGKLKYMGIGDAKRASSWSCVGGTKQSRQSRPPLVTRTPKRTTREVGVTTNYSLVDEMVENGDQPSHGCLLR